MLTGKTQRFALMKGKEVPNCCRNLSSLVQLDGFSLLDLKKDLLLFINIEGEGHSGGISQTRKGS